MTNDHHTRMRVPAATDHRRLTTDHRHVVIIGGGIAGLAAAYELQERARADGRPLTYTLLEASQNLGGKLVTEHVASPVGDFVVEGGPDSFLTQKPWAAELCRRLGLDDDLIGTNDARRSVFILHRGRLTRLPEGMVLIVPTRLKPVVRSPLFSWRGKLRMALEPFIPSRRDDGDESIATFVRRRLGREVVETLAEPLLSGIYAAAPEQQSLLGTFPRYRDLELKHGSLIRGTLAQKRTSPPAPPLQGKGVGGLGSSSGLGSPPSAFLTLRGGTHQLVRALEGALVDGQVRTGEEVTHLEWDGAGYYVRTDTGAHLNADAVVLATPAYVSGALLEDIAPQLAGKLNSIRYVSTATVSLGFRRADVIHPLDGFGFVVPRGERRRIFGCTWTSTKFDHRAPEQGVLLRCFVGGAGREELVALSDDELLGLVRGDLRAIMGIDAQPIITRIFRWHRSNPQYDVGHPDRVRAIYALCAARPGLFLTGSAFEGVGIPDCVRHGQETAGNVLAYLARQASC